MKYKSVKLNGILLLILVIIMLITNYFLRVKLGFIDAMSKTTPEVLTFLGENMASLNTWFIISLSIPLLLFSVIFMIRKVLYKGSTLTAYATNFGVLGAFLMFLEQLRWVSLNKYLAEEFMTATLFEKQMIQVVFETVNSYFDVLAEIFIPLFFIIWTFMVGVIIVKTGALKRFIGFFSMFVALFGLVSLVLINVSMLSLIYYYLFLLNLFLISLGMLIYRN